MFFVYNPQEPRYTYDPEEVYQEYRRREYITDLQEQQRRTLFERELALEEARHRRALALLAQQEASRRQHQASRRFAPRRPQQHASGACACGQDPDACVAPDYQEIFRRRQARQQEEEDRSRDFHRDILARIFGVPTDAEGDTGTTDEPAKDASPVPIAQTAANNEKISAKAPAANEPSAIAPTVKDTLSKPTPATPTTVKPVAIKDSMPENQQTGELEPHWSNATNRTQSLAEITATNRAFTSLKNTFVFPSGPLEGISGSDIPRLAYNATNAAIHAYQHALADLLIQLDGIESFGFQGVREARKQLVVKIEQAMGELERMITERLGGSAAPTTDQSTIKDVKEQKDNPDVVMGDANEPATTSTDPTTAIVIPETSVATETSLHKDSEDVTMSETAASSTHDTAKDTKTNDGAQSEKPATAPAPAPSAPEEQELDNSVPAPADSNPSRIAPIDSSPAKAKSLTFSVTDEEDWEIEDAVKTVA